MPEEYTRLAEALKALTKEPATTAEEPEHLPFAENGWNTRPDTDSYGIVQLDFEADTLYGDDQKLVSSWEGSVDLYSRKKDGDGWLELICRTLTEYCESAWSMNYFTHERESGLFHWEWVFEVEG